MNKGIMYVMSTVVDGLIKVGITKTENYEQRMYILEHNGYCNVTGLKRQFAIEVDEYTKKENLFKNLFERSRVADTELYSLDLEQVIQLLSSFEGTQIFPKGETKQEVFEKAADAVDSGELPDGIYTFSSTVKAGNGKEEVHGTLLIENGKLKVLKGAKFSSENKISDGGYREKRDSLIGKLENGILIEDCECTSVSMAVTIICGRNRNGWNEWKDPNGNLINTYRNKQLCSDENFK
jgi:hypothetical protein